MRGDIICKILSSIKEAGILVEDLATVILSEGYGASSGRLEWALNKRRTARELGEFANDSKHKYAAMIYKLKKDGLIAKREGKIYLTGKGESKLAWLKQKFLKKDYKSKPANNFIIVAYDIPRKKDKERHWIRESLENMKFKMIQRSVWAGKIELPEDFLDDIKKLDLIDCVEIFEITKTGTLHKI
ncbi:MAG: CRISPR-associated endonuclease Cas2 [Candidatus Liptonbacteria bacterium]|nr:CRISPR-associated endonuclease Cas2 [Candidatus Liptonbacteria bacterium]